MTISLLSALALAALATADKAPPARHDLDALLAKPVSPGVIALLVPHIASESASARVIAALSHEDAAVRAASARVVSVTALAPARAAVRRALDEGALECADQPEPSAVERFADPAEGKVIEPRKVKNVAPRYPPRAMADRRQGVVILEAIISESGCIRSVRVVHGVSPELDAEAIVAVGQWRYRPSLMNGRPVAVIMKVTVNFRLS